MSRILIACEEEWYRHKKNLAREFDVDMRVNPAHYPCVVIDKIYEHIITRRDCVEFEFVYREDFPDYGNIEVQYDKYEVASDFDGNVLIQETKGINKIVKKFYVFKDTHGNEITKLYKEARELCKTMNEEIKNGKGGV